MDKIYIVILESNEGTSYDWYIMGCYKSYNDAKFCLNECAEMCLEANANDNSIINTGNEILINFNDKNHSQKLYIEERICYGGY